MHNEFRMSLDRYAKLRKANQSFCLTCRAKQDDVEPNARRYICTICREKQVFGVEELRLMGRVRILL